jgi:hypothetical protein
MRGSLGIFLGCLILTVLVSVTAVGLTMVVTETNEAQPMSTNQTEANYSPYAEQREAGDQFMLLITIGLWASAILLMLVTFGSGALVIFT